MLNLGKNAAAFLKAHVERIISIGEERAELKANLDAEYEDCKKHGLDTPAIRRLIKRLKMPDQDRVAQESLDELYWTAFQDATPQSAPLAETGSPPAADSPAAAPVAAPTPPPAPEIQPPLPVTIPKDTDDLGYDLDLPPEMRT